MGAFAMKRLLGKMWTSLRSTSKYIFLSFLLHSDYATWVNQQDNISSTAPYYSYIMVCEPKIQAGEKKRSSVDEWFLA